MHIGDIKKMCFNKDNIFIPSGYLECDGQEITEDMFPELYFHLSDGVSDGPIKLPKVKREKKTNGYVFVTLIAHTDNNINDIKKFNAEFMIKTEEPNNINVNKVRLFKRYIYKK